MLKKKYFSITEVSMLTNLPAHKLRYIEKVDSDISITKIRGRRYYTKQNIEYISKKYSDSTIPTKIPIKTDINMISRIDQLIEKFHRLAE